MTHFRIFETNNFIKAMEKIGGRDKLIIENKLKIKVYPQLKAEPHYGSHIKKLKKFHPETWRYRMGNYRIFYEINHKEKIVNIIGMATRQNAY